MGLYEYWGFRLDATPLFYLFSSPKDALASVSIWVVMAGLAAMAVYAALLYPIFYRVLIYQKQPVKIPFHRLSVSGVLLLATALLFIPIRGGFTVSTMNPSKAYFSSNQRLNHAAINPCFSLDGVIVTPGQFRQAISIHASRRGRQTLCRTQRPAGCPH
ncbi:hypothetical protein NXW60_10955 [Bacteroides fragilis]|nr:hypothetical protein NXW60_10955 [Bacteroides fragilis]